MLCFVNYLAYSFLFCLCGIDFCCDCSIFCVTAVYFIEIFFQHCSESIFKIFFQVQYLLIFLVLLSYCVISIVGFIV